MIGYAFCLNLMWMAGPEYEFSLLLGISDRWVIWMVWSICMMESDTLAFVLDYTGISVREMEFCIVHRLSQFQAGFPQFFVLMDQCVWVSYFGKHNC